ncbi:MAG: protein kinase [Cytophagales bacterium]|nr:protein kinase [Cytophagales bacterium]
MYAESIKAGLKRPRAAANSQGELPVPKKKKKAGVSLYPVKGTASSFVLPGKGKATGTRVKLMCRKYQKLPHSKIKLILNESVIAITEKKRFSYNQSGSYGRIVAAKSPFPDNDASKFVVKYNSEEDEFSAAAFLNEAQFQFQLKHPAILECPGYGYFTNRTFLLLPRKKQTLADAFKGGLALTCPVRLRLVREIAEGLIYLHRLHVVHKDLSSNNILLDSDSHGYIADFGSSLNQGANNPNRDITPEDIPVLFRGVLINLQPCVGHLYSAPDNLLSNTASFGVDIYSWGVILYSLVYGECIWKSWTNHQRCRMHLCRASSCHHLLQQDNPEKPLRSFTTISKMRNIDSSLQLPTPRHKHHLLKFLDLAKECLALQPEHRLQSMKLALTRFNNLTKEYERVV